MIEDGAKSTEVHCEYMTKKTPDGAMEIVVDLKQLKGGMFGRLIITSGSGGVVTGIVIQTNTGIKADSSIVDGEPYKKQEQEPKGKNSYGNDGYGDGGREDTDKDVIKTVITNKKGEKMEIISKLDGEKITIKGQVDLEGKAQLNQQLNVDYFIESPPLATIFAECDWKDWVSLEYPDKYRTGKEWELRNEARKNRKYRD